NVYPSFWQTSRSEDALEHCRQIWVASPFSERGTHKGRYGVAFYFAWFGSLAYTTYGEFHDQST
ncbi:MAG: hypothetical protein ACLFTO_05805, partial [Candidatus Acetothermia bacterium]